MCSANAEICQTLSGISLGEANQSGLDKKIQQTVSVESSGTLPVTPHEIRQTASVKSLLAHIDSLDAGMVKYHFEDLEEMIEKALSNK